MIQKYTYLNAAKYKLKNRRIIVAIQDNGLINIQFDLLTNRLKPKAHHTIKKDKIVITSLGLTVEACAALCDGLLTILTKLGYNSISDVNKANLNECVDD